MTDTEFVAQLREWATEDRAQAEAKRQAVDVPDAAEQEAVMHWFAGLADGLHAQQIEAQASAFKAATHGNKAAADVLDATAAAWDEIAQAVEDQVDSGH